MSERYFVVLFNVFIYSYIFIYEMHAILMSRQVQYSTKHLSTGNIFLIMGKLIEFSETTAGAGAFLPAGICHAKRIMFSFGRLQ